MNTRTWHIVTVLALPALLTGAGILQAFAWYKSPVAAVDLSAWARSSATARTLRFEDLSFTVPAEWKTASYKSDLRYWLALRSHNARAVLIACIISQSNTGHIARTDEADHKLGKAKDAAMYAVTDARLALHPKRLGKATAEKPDRPAPEGWHAFVETAVIDPSRKSLTLWRATGTHVVTVTIERGSPEDPEIKEFLDSFRLSQGARVGPEDARREVRDG